MLRMGYLSYKCSYEEVDQKVKAWRTTTNYTPSEDASPVDCSMDTSNLVGCTSILSSLEWWASEVLIFLSGLVPNPKLETSVLTICFSITYLHYFIPYGIGATARTRVANEMGAGNAQAAKMAFWIVASGTNHLPAVPWSPPAEGFLKVNVGATWNHSTKVVVVDAVVRNHEEDILFCPS
ncbi:hypothetical protein PTKIN_Ptkin08bG0106600 [Pterospermum kingtungense]